MEATKLLRDYVGDLRFLFLASVDGNKDISCDQKQHSQLAEAFR
jgi:hypothetical protein